MKRHYVKILSILGICISLSGLLASCGGAGSSSAANSGSSAVSLTVGGPGQAAKNMFSAHVKNAIPSNVSSITFTISAPDITTITKTDEVAGQNSITETFTVANGNSRRFEVDAYDSTGMLAYTGSTTADLNGSAVTLDITMAAAASAAYIISGTVTSNSSGFPGVTVTLSGTASATATTDSSGNYSFSVTNGSYAVTPSLAGYLFSPASSTVAVNGSNISGQNFTASIITSQTPLSNQSLAAMWNFTGAGNDGASTASGTMTLNADGTAVVVATETDSGVSSPVNGTGTWTFNQNILTITFNEGAVYQGTVQGNSISFTLPSVNNGWTLNFVRSGSTTTTTPTTTSTTTSAGTSTTTSVPGTLHSNCTGAFTGTIVSSSINGNCDTATLTALGICTTLGDTFCTAASGGSTAYYFGNNMQFPFNPSDPTGVSQSNAATQLIDYCCTY